MDVRAAIANINAWVASGKDTAYQRALAINPNAPPLPEGSAVGEYGQTNVIGLPFGTQLTPQLQQQLKAYQDAGFTLQYREPPTVDKGLFSFITDPLAQLDKDLSLSQNAPLIATIAATIALPGVGASIGNSLLSAELLPVGTSLATATAVGTGVANAALQVAQGKPVEDALKAGVVGAAGGAVGSYLVGDPGTLNNFVTSTSTNLLAGKNPEDAVKAGITSSGAGLAGSTVAGETGSAVAGQVAAGTTAGLLAGQTGEQALIRGVSNIKVDGLTSSIPPSTTAFDTTQDISDTSGFDIPTPLPQTPITGNTGGNMATYDEEMNAPATELQDTTPFNYSPEEQQIIYQLAQEAGGTQNINDAYAALTQAAQQTATQSGLKVGDVLNFFKKNPSLTKGLVTAGVSAAGGLLTNQANVQAAQISAQAIRDAAATAAEAQKFRPVGVTTRFGASQFGFDPTTGQLTSAGYQLTPELKAMQDRIMALSGKGLTEAEQAAGRYAPLTAGAQGLFGLGQQYLAQSPEQVAADYMAKQQNLLAPSRERQLSQLQNQLFQTGRGGLSVGATGARPSGAAGLGAASPEMEAYYNALAQQDAALAAQATQAGQQQVQFGAGLLGSGANLLGSYTQGLTGAYAPFSTGVGVGSSLESLGQAPLDIGAQLGGRSAQAGGNVGQTLLQGGLLGARTTQAASGVSPFGTALTGLANSPEAQQALAQWLNSGAGYGTNTRQLDTNTNF
jgi:hypothetical protein